MPPVSLPPPPTRLRKPLRPHHRAGVPRQPVGEAGAAVGGGVLLRGRSCGVPGGGEGRVLLSDCAALSTLEARGGAEGVSR